MAFFENPLLVAARALAAAALCSSLCFASGFQFQSSTTQFRSGNNTISYLYVADVNQDGKPDIITTDVISGTVYIFLGKGDGTFRSPVLIPLNLIVLPVIVADVNGDGHPDLVVGGLDSSLSNALAVLKGNGDGTFQAPQMTRLAAFPTALAAVDINHAGRLDVVVEESKEGLSSGVNIASLFSLPGPQLEFLLNDGKGNLTPGPAQTLPGSTGLRIAAADFNGDGYPDLAVNQISTGYVEVLLNLKNGTFGNPATYPSAAGFQINGGQLLTTDINGDGKSDLVMTTGQNGTVAVYLGNGDGTFQPAQFIAQQDAGGLAVADFNNDGIPDIAVGTTFSSQSILAGTDPANATADPVVILQGAAGGTFPIGSTQVGSGMMPLILETADFNGDGLPDLVATNLFRGSFTVYLNQSLGNANSVAIVSAAANISMLAANALAAAYGTNLASGTFASQSQPLSTTLGGVNVLVEDSSGIARQAPLVFVSVGQIDFLIPDGTAPGLARVTINGSPVASPATMLTIAVTAPAVFTANSSGKGVPAALAARVNNADNRQTVLPVFTCVGAGQCVGAPISLDSNSSVYLSLYATGVRGAKNVTAAVNGVPVPVQFFGAQRQFAGLDQINLVLTSAISAHGDATVILSADGIQSNPVKLTLQ